ncbi:MAG: hypothetical protein OHK0023_16790 [Anaerolineae bacterium]
MNDTKHDYTDWIISKRVLGLIFVGLGALGFVGLLLLDALRGGGEFGPSQLAALGGCVALTVVGLTLIPLGDRPA